MGNKISKQEPKKPEDGAIVSKRPPPGFIAELLAHPVYSLASRINRKYIEFLMNRGEVGTQGLNWSAVRMSLGVSQRLAVKCRGHLSLLLMLKLISFRSERSRKRALKPAIAVLSKQNIVGLKNTDATCVSTLQGHNNGVRSVAFHPSAPYLATGSGDKTKLWLLNADCSVATCVSTLQGHSCRVHSVAFHPSAPYLATGSVDKTVKLWG